MNSRQLTALAGALALTAAPLSAQAAAGAPVRTTEPVSEAGQMEMGGDIVRGLVIVIIAAVGMLVLILTDDDDEPASP